MAFDNSGDYLGIHSPTWYPDENPFAIFARQGEAAARNTRTAAPTATLDPMVTLYNIANGSSVSVPTSQLGNYSGHYWSRTPPAARSPEPAMLQQAPRQQPITAAGRQEVAAITDVQLGPEQKQLISLLSSELQNPESGLRKLLSGTPDWGQFQAGVAEPLMASQQQQVAGINNQYSGQGSSFFSGARERSQDEANNALQQKLAELRYQESQQAKQNMLAATGQLPALSNVLSAVTTNDIANMERSLETYYKNQGLNAQQAQQDLNTFRALVEQQNNLANQGISQAELNLRQMLAQDTMANSAVSRYSALQNLANGGNGGGGGGMSTSVQAPASWGLDSGESFFEKNRLRDELARQEQAARDAADEQARIARAIEQRSAGSGIGVVKEDGSYVTY